ncbi:RNA polymerase subunit sigma-70 [Corynebacterium poyangense]|uniref:RNA polymerase subunit sigma-70 n=1 Tax=Corynebacterium poyangense TaxID=2684405 RepID=A0A7H0SPL2_9CORY|nr:sugar-binding transcriptional regulator [Corynebacterium poyangense]QNQ90487.1 RNA polymerase subunit sigma-70 [Corynebacterium poyangense]
MEIRDEQALRAAKLYYLVGLGQAEVAKELGVSRPTVSKLLKLAKEKKFVVIEIHDPRESSGEAAEQLLERYRRYGVQEVRVVDAPRDSSEELLAELGRAGAELLSREVNDGYRVGVSWGRTMHAVAQALEYYPRRGVEIVQLKGGMSYTKSTTNDMETINLFCRAFDADARTLPLPVIFDNAETKHVVENDRHIAHLLQLGRTTEVVVFTVGHAHPDSLPLTLGYLTDSEIADLSTQAIGDVCSRFFNTAGDIANAEIDERTVGISLADLAQRPVRIMVAGGRWKAQAIDVAITMGLATHLVIDSDTATEILEEGWEEA